jgi:uncharacterized protein
MDKAMTNKQNKSIVEFRFQGNEYQITKNKLEGYGAIFNAKTQLFPGLTETIRSGSFAKTLQENPDVLCSYNHDMNMVLGRTNSKTLKVAEDTKGLHYSVDLPNTTFATDLRESIDRGDVSGSSFMFQVIKDKWTGTSQDQLRSITEVRLFELGPVSMPQYTQTSVSLRSKDNEFDFDKFQFIYLKQIRGNTLDAEEVRFIKNIFDQFSFDGVSEPQTHSEGDEPDNIYSTLARLQRRKLQNKLLGVI